MTVYNQNDENVLKFLNELIQSTRAPMPEFLKDQGSNP